MRIPNVVQKRSTLCTTSVDYPVLPAMTTKITPKQCPSPPRHVAYSQSLVYCVVIFEHHPVSLADHLPRRRRRPPPPAHVRARLPERQRSRS